MKEVNVPPKGLIHKDDKDDLKIRKGLKKQISKILISPTYIRERIRVLADKIIKDFKTSRSKALQVIIVLKGATAFANDLAQEIYKKGGPPVRFNYIKASSYGTDISSSGAVKITGEIPYIQNRHILIIDDIADTGLTISKLKEYLLEERRAASVKICVLLDKKARRLPSLRKKLNLDYVGFKVPDTFVAGYGIDCAEHFRELPYIVAVNENYFKKKKKKKRKKLK